MYFSNYFDGSQLNEIGSKNCCPTRHMTKIGKLFRSKNISLVKVIAFKLASVLKAKTKGTKKANIRMGVNSLLLAVTLTLTQVKVAGCRHQLAARISGER